MIPLFRLPSAMSRPGWRRCVLALALGLCSALALPPVYAVPLLWPGLAGFVVLAASAPGWRSAAFEGWCFGVGWFGFGLYWIGNAFLVDAEAYGALMPFAVSAMAMGMALFLALVGAGVQLMVHRLDIGRLMLVPAFAGCWTFSEWVRSWFLTGFPWNPLSSVWGVSPEMMQGAAAFGALGLSLMAALVFAAPAVLISAPHGQRRQMFIAVLAISLLVPAQWLGGWLRLLGAGTVTHPDMVMRLVQPSIPQADKWIPALRQGHVIRQMAMSKRTPGPAGAPTTVIWAETNVPYMIEPNSVLPATLAAAVPAGGTLIFGAPRRDAEGQVFNSMLAIDDDGDVVATFDKFHLVPFGEYVPLRSWLPVNKLTDGRGDFTAGEGPKTLHIKGLPPFAALICYEVIFSGNVVDASDRPEWILNITNDGWFGQSTGPRQHLVQARFRAVEEGLPLVRVANTGISAVIDAYGRVSNSLDLDRQGVVDAPLPEALAPTPFARLGQWIGLFMTLASLLFAARRWVIRRIQQ